MLRVGVEGDAGWLCLKGKCRDIGNHTQDSSDVPEGPRGREGMIHLVPAAAAGGVGFDGAMPRYTMDASWASAIKMPVADALPPALLAITNAKGGYYAPERRLNEETCEDTLCADDTCEASLCGTGIYDVCDVALCGSDVVDACDEALCGPDPEDECEAALCGPEPEDQCEEALCGPEPNDGCDDALCGPDSSDCSNVPAWCINVCAPFAHCASLTGAQALLAGCANSPQGCDSCEPYIPCLSSPPPSASPTPPPAPVEFTVTTSITVAGDISSFPLSVTDAIGAAVAAEVNVPEEAVTVTATAASVLLTIEIETQTSAAATAVTSTLSTTLATPATAAVFLETAVPTMMWEVEAITAPTFAAAADGGSSSDDDEMSAGAIAGIIFLVVTVIGCLAIAVVSLNNGSTAAAPTKTVAITSTARTTASVSATSAAEDDSKI